MLANGKLNHIPSREKQPSGNNFRKIRNNFCPFRRPDFERTVHSPSSLSGDPSGGDYWSYNSLRIQNEVATDIGGLGVAVPIRQGSKLIVEYNRCDYPLQWGKEVRC